MNALQQEGVLGDFARKLRTENTQCIFVSSDPVPDFKALIGKATLVETVEAFWHSLSDNDNIALSLLEKNWQVQRYEMFQWLRRCRVEIVSDDTLWRSLDAHCNLIFRNAPVHAIASVKDYLEKKVTHTLTTEQLRQVVQAELGLQFRSSWSPTIERAAADVTASYLGTLRTTIMGQELSTPFKLEALSALSQSSHSNIILSGQAGSGKSAVIAALINAAQADGIPVLAFRIDRHLNSTSAAQLGHALLGIAENPVSMFGDRHMGRQCLIVIDQVDAVSEASGRSAQAREILFELVRTAGFYQPEMKVVLACRTYDLENDYRLKQFSGSVATTTVSLGHLDWETAVLPILNQLGVADRTYSDHEKRILTLPINLHLFSEIIIAGENIPSGLSTSLLIDALIAVRAKEAAMDGHRWSLTEALGAIASSMSKHQELTAPAAVLTAYPEALTTLSSAGFIFHDRSKVQFTHESFFDNIFAYHFLAEGTSLLDLLLSDEQRLFRRTQVRQILTKLRDQGVDRRYFDNLNAVMSSQKVRYLVKDAIGSWLAMVEDPNTRELGLVFDWFTPGHELSNVARGALFSKSWGKEIITSSVFEKWLSSEGENRDTAKWILRMNAAEHSALVAVTLQKYFDADSTRLNELLDWYRNLYLDKPADEIEQFYKVLIGLVPEEMFADRPISSLMDLSHWAHCNLAVAARVLGYWYARWFEVHDTGTPFGDHFPIGSDEHWWKEIVEKEPLAFLTSLLPSFAKAIERDHQSLVSGEVTYSQFSHIRFEPDYPRDYMSFAREALCTVAKEAPEEAERLLNLLPLAAQHTLHFVLEAIASNGVLGHRLPKLLAHPRLLKAGFDGTKWSSFASAAGSAKHCLDADVWDRIEQIALGYIPEIRRAKAYLGLDRDAGGEVWKDAQKNAKLVFKQSGYSQWGILLAIGKENLSSTAQRRLDELGRKFAGKTPPERCTSRSGWVISPIGTDAAEKMTNAQWLSAFRHYKSDRGREFMTFVGGAGELAQVLQQQAKSDPERFVRLLEIMPADMNASYFSGIINGIRESDASSELVLKVIRMAMNKDDRELKRMVGWLIQKHPDVGQENDVLTYIFNSAVSDEASDTIISSSRPTPEGDPSIRQLLGDNGDFEASGMNSVRGGAYRAIGNMLWRNGNTLDQAVAFMTKQIKNEPLRSVRTQMMHVIGAVATHDVEKGLGLLLLMGERDLNVMCCNAGHSVLNWASFNYAHKVWPLVERLVKSNSDHLRAHGLFQLSGMALHDDDKDRVFSEICQNDLLGRRIAAFRGSGNVCADGVGAKAASWLIPLFEDGDREVRREASHCNWEQLLAKNTSGHIIDKYIKSTAFGERPEMLLRVLEEKVDMFPDLTMRTVDRIVSLLDQWRTEGKQTYGAVHSLSRTLVNLYRHHQGDRNQEAKILDLFDIYLARDIHGARSAISNYERH